MGLNHDNLEHLSMKYSIDGKSFNAVISCAARGDVRYYLEGFCIDADALMMVATDGSIMAEAPVTVADADDVPLAGAGHGTGACRFSGYLFSAPTKPLPKSVETVVIDTAMSRLELYGSKYKGPQYVAIAPIDGTFPSYQSVSARDLKPNGEVPSVAFNALLLAKPLQWAKVSAPGCAITFGIDNDSAMKVTYGGLPGVVVTLMPMRM